MDTIPSLSQGEFNPWDKWNREKADEATWMAVRVARLAWNKERFLDLGMGYGRDSRYLLDHFEEGVGVDKYPVPAGILRSFPTSRFSFVKSTIENFVIPPDSFGAIIAPNSLYFCEKERYSDIFAGVHAGLCNGGMFILNLLDTSDPYAKNPPPNQPVSVICETELKKLLRGFKVIEYCRKVVMNGKEWHNHNLVLEKL